MRSQGNDAGAGHVELDVVRSDTIEQVDETTLEGIAVKGFNGAGDQRGEAADIA